jgi:hypothetical protein
MLPTTVTALTNASPSQIVNIEAGGVVNGNVIVATSAALSDVGAGAEGIVIGGNICDEAGCSAGAPTAADAGTFINEGTITVSGVEATSTSAAGIKPEGGSALLIAGNIQGGIVNEGPTDTSGTVSAATISGNGFTENVSGTPVIAAVISIAPIVSGTPITIGPDTNDPVNPSSYSFVNYGDITASPTNSNASTTDINIAGSSATAFTTLTGGFFSSGRITATADSTTGTGSSDVAANAILFNDFSVVPKVEISGISNGGTSGSTLGEVVASISGTEGGHANAIGFTTFFNGGSGATNIGILSPAKVFQGSTLKIDQFATVEATATTTQPNVIQVLDATAIDDESGTLTEIDNGGTILASVTSLSATPGTGFSNNAHAIFLVGSSQSFALNNTGSITGDVILNGSGNETVVVGGGTANGSTDVNQIADAANAVTATGVFNSAAHGATLTGDLAFGIASNTSSNTLYVNDFGTVSGAITTGTLNSPGTLNVGISTGGTLDVLNTGQTGSMVVKNFNDYGGQLFLSVNDSLRRNGEATIEELPGSGGTINIVAGPQGLRPAFTSFVPLANGPDTFVQYKLVEGPSVTVADLAEHQQDIENNLPFYFKSNAACISGVDLSGCSLQFISPGGTDELVLNLTPKSAAELGLTGDAKTMYPIVTQEMTAQANLVTDDQLGAAIIKGITNQQTAENIFSQFAPDVSGNERAIAISLTDSATGPVSARQRDLNMYANQEGDLTLWAQEWAQFFSQEGTLPSGGLNNYKDHGFGVTIGADMGDPKNGWYGGALSFFNGDASEVLPRDARSQTEWFMATGYTDWRGRHLFLDTHVDVGLGNITGKRFLIIPNPADLTGAPLAAREADSKSAALLGALGATTGAVFNWGDLFLMPEMSLDGMAMRQEGYTETGGGNGGNGDGFDLKTSPYYANSLRTFLGADSRIDLDLGDFLLQPEARLGYRFDFLNDPVKVRAAFVADPTDTFEIVGPDPSRGNVVAGAAIGASTDTWSMGVNFDWVRGSNGSVEEVGTFTLLGRI